MRFVSAFLWCLVKNNYLKIIPYSYYLVYLHR
nr:MAG TPA: hypothetical protein [Caudoviricetes sp.]